MVLCLPRLTVLVSIEADRPGIWFPGTLGPCHDCFIGIGLDRDFERVKVSGNPMKSPFYFGVFWGVKFLRSLSAQVDSRSRKTLVEWPEQCNERNLSFHGVIARRPQGRALQPFFGPNFAPRFRGFAR
jgi:hypothetical protein